MHKTIWMPILTVMLAAAVLLAGYNLSDGYRQERIREELTGKMQTILPGSRNFVQEEYTGGDTNIRSVHKGETGYVVETETYGYAGNITMLIGVSNEGLVTGLQVRDMQETHGLGGEALWDWEFLAQFLNTTGNVAIGADGVDALTGATVTSKAIARSVNAAVGFVTGADAVSAATSWGG